MTNAYLYLTHSTTLRIHSLEGSPFSAVQTSLLSHLPVTARAGIADSQSETLTAQCIFLTEVAAHDDAGLCKLFSDAVDESTSLVRPFRAIPLVDGKSS
jgi:hypothetical protein